MILEALDEVNQRLEMSSIPVYYAWQLDGNRVKSFMDIHQNCRIIVVSQEKSFKGIDGLDQFQGFLQTARPRQDTEQIKPKPGTWIQTAAVSWLRTNDTTDMPNLADAANAYTNARSAEVDKVDQSN